MHSENCPWTLAFRKSYCAETIKRFSVWTFGFGTVFPPLNYEDFCSNINKETCPNKLPRFSKRRSCVVFRYYIWLGLSLTVGGFAEKFHETDRYTVHIPIPRSFNTSSQVANKVSLIWRIVSPSWSMARAQFNTCMTRANSCTFFTRWVLYDGDRTLTSVSRLRSLRGIKTTKFRFRHSATPRRAPWNPNFRSRPFSFVWKWNRIGAVWNSLVTLITLCSEHYLLLGAFTYASIDHWGNSAKESWLEIWPQLLPSPHFDPATTRKKAYLCVWRAMAGYRYGEGDVLIGPLEFARHAPLPRS